MSDEYRDYLDELRSEVEKKAKRANQRLRQLEMSGITESSRAYQVTAQRAYDNILGYKYNKAGEIVFDRSVKNKTIQELEQELENLDKFLEARTSKARGYKEQLKESYQGYLESQDELDEEKTEATGKPVPVSGGTSFAAWQHMFTSVGSQHYGYQTVRALQGVPGATKTIIEKTLRAAIREERAQQRALDREAKALSKTLGRKVEPKKAKKLGAMNLRERLEVAIQGQKQKTSPKAQRQRREARRTSRTRKGKSQKRRW